MVSRGEDDNDDDLSHLFLFLCTVRQVVVPGVETNLSAVVTYWMDLADDQLL